MKIGDLVKLKSMHRRQKQRVGLIVELLDKKCWRTDKLGKSVDWSKIEPEPHAVILVDGRRLTIPVEQLQPQEAGP